MQLGLRLGLDDVRIIRPLADNNSRNRSWVRLARLMSQPFVCQWTTVDIISRDVTDLLTMQILTERYSSLAVVRTALSALGVTLVWYRALFNFSGYKSTRHIRMPFLISLNRSRCHGGTVIWYSLLELGEFRYRRHEGMISCPFWFDLI